MSCFSDQLLLSLPHFLMITSTLIGLPIGENYKHNLLAQLSSETSRPPLDLRLVPGVFDTTADQKSHFFVANLCSHIFPPSISGAISCRRVSLTRLSPFVMVECTSRGWMPHDSQIRMFSSIFTSVFGTHMEYQNLF